MNYIITLEFKISPILMKLLIKINLRTKIKKIPNIKIIYEFPYLKE
jgi:hypothetical protein